MPCSHMSPVTFITPGLLITLLTTAVLQDLAPSGCSCRANCVPADPPVPIDLIPVERLTPSEGDEELPIAMPTRDSPFTVAPTAGGEQCCLDACEVRAAL